MKVCKTSKKVCKKCSNCRLCRLTQTFEKVCTILPPDASARPWAILQALGGLDSPTHFEFRAIYIALWLGVPSYLYFDVAWSSELFVFSCGLEFRAICSYLLWLGVPSSVVVFVFQCGLEFRAICILLWLGVPSYLYFAVAWSSELFVAICCDFCKRLDSPTHFDFCKWLDFPTHFDFCKGLPVDSPIHSNSCDGNYKGFIIADLLIRRTTGMPAAVQQRRRRSKWWCHASARAFRPPPCVFNLLNRGCRVQHCLDQRQWGLLHWQGFQCTGRERRFNTV